MKMTYLIIVIILSCGSLFDLTSSGNKSNDINQEYLEKNTTTPKLHHTDTSTFNELRAKAFNTSADQLQLSLPNDKTIVYGIIMDWEIGGAIATIVSYQTGDASLYLSSGGGIIGAGQHENVNNAAKQFVSLGQSYLEKATKTETTALPTTNQIRFYLLTNKGTYLGQENLINFENNSSEWLKLFEEGNKVLTEIQIIKEKK